MILLFIQGDPGFRRDDKSNAISLFALVDFFLVAPVNSIRKRP